MVLNILLLDFQHLYFCTFKHLLNFWWSICNHVYMSGHYRIGKHYLGCPNNCNGYYYSSQTLFKSLPAKTLFNPQPKFNTDPINIPPLTKFVLSATTISILMVGITTLSDWVTFYSNKLSQNFCNCCFWHFRWGRIDLSVTIPHYVVTNWYFLWCIMWMWIYVWYYVPKLDGWMNESVDFVVLIYLPTPSLSIYFEV